MVLLIDVISETDMIDISEKNVTERIAKATGRIHLKEQTIELIKKNKIEKGDAFTIAKVAAINAVKKTPDFIPFCHPIPIMNVSVEFEYEKDFSLKVICTVKSHARTGVEMEALAGVSAALLNIWDVVKKHEKNELGQYPHTFITDLKVEEKIKNK